MKFITLPMVRQLFIPQKTQTLTPVLPKPTSFPSPAPGFILSVHSLIQQMAFEYLLHFCALFWVLEFQG